MSASRSASTRWSRASRPKATSARPTAKSASRSIAELIRQDQRVQAHPHRDRLGQHLRQLRFDHRRGAGVRPLGRSRLPRTPDGRRRGRRAGRTQAALLVLGQLQLLHRDRQIPRGAHAVGQHRQGLQPSKNCACKMHIHARTADWNQTVYDPYVNMLRGTTEAMSATIAGVHSLEVTPFDAAFESPTEFSKRIARNVELLLKHESHFDQVVDPAGGSYYVENLTQSIAAEAWKLFLEIEEKGGYTEAYKAGFIASASKRRPQPRTRTSQRAARRCSAPTSIPTLRRSPARRSPPSPSRVQLPRATSSSLPRRHGVRGDAPARGSQRQAAQGVHADVRQLGDGPRPLAVLVQLLRLRRHPRAGQHLLQVDRRGREGRTRIESQIVVVCAATTTTQRPHRRSRSCSAARRFSWLQALRLRTRTGSAGHHELHHREVERLGNSEVLS